MERIDAKKFGKNNYLTAPKNAVGVASHGVYYTQDQYNKNQSRNNSSSKTFFDKRSNRTQSDSKKKMTFEKIKVVQKMLSNEKTVSIIRVLSFIGNIDAE